MLSASVELDARFAEPSLSTPSVKKKLKTPSAFGKIAGRLEGAWIRAGLREGRA
jgi:hypothetical protein